MLSTKKLKLICKILIFLGSFIAVERLCHVHTRGFSLPNIYSYEPDSSHSEPISFDAEILSQPFTLFASGLECYAFLSEDQKFVLKVFKFHHVREARLFYKLFPFSYFAKLLREKEDRIAHSFESNKLAYQELKEETGLVCIHLEKTERCYPQVTLIDSCGIRHQVNLDEVHFILQKKADLLVPALKKQNEDQARRSISSLLNLILTRCQKGIGDRDPTLYNNYGFIGDEAVIIDTGSFSYQPLLKNPKTSKRTLFYETLPLRCMLAKHFPFLLPHFESEFEKILENP
jgi:hypothetical protein